MSNEDAVAERTPVPKGRKIRCAGETWNGYHFYRCFNNAKIIEGGKAYCGVHDPEKTRQRDAARRVKREAEDQARRLERAKKDAANRLIATAVSFVEGHLGLSELEEAVSAWKSAIASKENDDVTR